MQLITIGNSKGIRIPKAIIKQAQLEDVELDFEVKDEGLLISPIKKHPRQHWHEAIMQALQENPHLSEEDNEWLGATLTTDIDE